MGEKPDKVLLAHWKQGDRHAGEALIDRYADALHRFLVPKVGDAAEDAMQQVFLSLLEGGARFEGRSSLRTYLFAIARRTVYRHYRDRKRHPSFDRTPVSFVDLRTSPSGIAARQEAHQLLRMAVQGLPLEQQMTLELLYWERMPPAEVAEVLEIPANTVYTRARRARERLREALSELDPRFESSQAVVDDLLEHGVEQQSSAPPKPSARRESPDKMCAGQDPPCPESS